MRRLTWHLGPLRELLYKIIHLLTDASMLALDYAQLCVLSRHSTPTLLIDVLFRAFLPPGIPGPMGPYIWVTAVHLRQLVGM